MSTGYTLPVFACASAIAALRHLQQPSPVDQVEVNLLNPPRQVEIKIEQVAKIDADSAIAITRSDPGDHLDLTRNTPIWAKVDLVDNFTRQITLQGGAGIGRQQNNHNQAAIYTYAQELIIANLQPLLDEHQGVIVTIILPEGARLAKRTSNEAFGVVKGLSLLGTTGIVAPLTAQSQLEEYQQQIKDQAKLFDSLVFCIGENGIDLAQKSGIEPQRIIKTANWLGAMLVTAAAAQVKSILLFGYHGKLIKLAGGIFHTHNHLADARLEIMTAFCARLGLPKIYLEQIWQCSTTESALELLRQLDSEQPERFSWVDLIYSKIAQAIDCKSENYIYKYTEQNLQIGSVLFDRDRQVIKKSETALLLLSELC
ncbi:MAG: cobalt-precorrin-5B (C(1))-methyltransferase CbiD [Cyanobacteria bacterium P01_G01_bin.39]